MMAVRKLVFLLLILTAAPVSDATTLAPNTTTNATTPATSTEIREYGVVFRSLQNFSDDLVDPSSAAFMARASMIQTQLDPKLKSDFPNTYRSTEVLAFRSGSIFNIMKMFFLRLNSPNETQIEASLVRASTNVTGFDIDVTFITVNGVGSGINASSSGVTHKISLITAFCLVLLSWFLTKQE